MLEELERNFRNILFNPIDNLFLNEEEIVNNFTEGGTEHGNFTSEPTDDQFGQEL